MDKKQIQMLLEKSKSQLIEEFKNLKPEPYVTGIKAALIIVIMYCINNYFNEPVTDKMAITFAVAGGFILLEILFVLARMEKKINLLFAIEKIKEPVEDDRKSDEEK